MHRDLAELISSVLDVTLRRMYSVEHETAGQDCVCGTLALWLRLRSSSASVRA